MSEEYELDEYGYPVGFTPRRVDKEEEEEEEYELDKYGYPIGFTPRVKEEQPKPSMQQLDDTASDRETPSFFEGPASMYPAKLAMALARNKTPAEKADLARVAASIPIGTTKLVYDAIDIAQSQFTDEEWGDEPFNNFVRKTALASGIDSDTVNSVLSDDGKIKKVTTNIGTVAEVGSWIAGFKGVKKLLGEGDTLFTEGLKLTGASAITAQALSDPSYNTGNMLEDFLKDTDNFNNGYTMVVADALAANDDDSVAMKRLKILGEEPLFIALGFTGKKGAEALGWAGRNFRTYEIFFNSYY